MTDDEILDKYIETHYSREINNCEKELQERFREIVRGSFGFQSFLLGVRLDILGNRIVEAFKGFVDDNKD